VNPSSKPPGEGGEPPKRSISTGQGRSAASTRLQAIRIALSHEIVRAGRILDRRGMIVATEGNLSARLAPDRFLITRRGRRKGEMKTRDLVELAIDGASEDSSLASASTEHRVHRIAYKLRPDVDAAGASARALRPTCSIATKGYTPPISRPMRSRSAIRKA